MGGISATIYNVGGSAGRRVLVHGVAMVVVRGELYYARSYTFSPFDVTFHRVKKEITGNWAAGRRDFLFNSADTILLYCAPIYYYVYTGARV